MRKIAFSRCFTGILFFLFVKDAKKEERNRIDDPKTGGNVSVFLILIGKDMKKGYII